MQLDMLIFLCLAAGSFAAPISEKRDGVVYGFDVSNYQPSVDWSTAYNTGGLRFVYIKATQGTDYIDPSFSSHYEGATNAGFIRGGYHFAGGTTPASAEADYFVEHGGGWTADGITCTYSVRYNTCTV
jgi:GH25 family lysozyme M1 (1,4-beta-N-acetylmuramidase)